VRKLRLAVALPTIQFVFAVITLQQPSSGFYVSTSRLVCWGLSAPALLFRVQASWGPLSTLVPASMFGIPTSDLFFLVGVIVVWYLVGRAVDRRLWPKPARTTPTITVVVRCFLVAVGGLLSYAALEDFHDPTLSNIGRRPERGILTLAWGAGLVIFAGRGIVMTIRSARLNGQATLPPPPVRS
jgi:hypothetical protein